MRVIDKIWDRLISDKKYENEEYTYIEMNKKSYDSLLNEYAQEFLIDEVTMDDLEYYFRLKISVKQMNEDFRFL